MKHLVCKVFFLKKNEELIGIEKSMIKSFTLHTIFRLGHSLLNEIRMGVRVEVMIFLRSTQSVILAKYKRSSLNQDKIKFLH